MIRERGGFDNRRYWGIEVNEVHQLYLGSYLRINSIDHLTKTCGMKYRFWYYLHSPMLHAMSLEAFVAFDMYIEVEEGRINQI